MFLEVKGINLYYEKTGQGRPLVMVHGNGESHEIFLEASEVLKESFTCYLPDSRGHGKSSPVSSLDYEEMAGDIIDFLEKLDLHDVVFYGFSDGGITGLLAAGRTDRISDLIVSGANLRPEGIKFLTRLAMSTAYFFKRDPKLALMVNQPHITSEDLKKIKARTLVLAGSRDLIKEEETRDIASGISGAELKILPGETHGSYIVHSRKIAGIIQEFCGKGRSRE